MTPNCLSEVAYFVQYRDKRFDRGHWSPWQICTPRYGTCREARQSLRRICRLALTGWWLWPMQWRLVRCTTSYERLPLKTTTIYATGSSVIKVLARREADPPRRTGVAGVETRGSASDVAGGVRRVVV